MPVGSTLYRAAAGLAALVLALFLGAVGCESHTDRKLKELNITEDQAKKILSEISGHPAQEPAPGRPTDARLESGETRTRAIDTPQGLDPSLVSADWVVDALVDVAKAAPSRAISSGVVVINGNNELWLAALSDLPKGPQPAETALSPLEDAQGPFALGRGPAVADGYAYWVTRHFLLRRPVTPPFGPLEILAEDARVGTRPAALPRSKEKKRHSTWVAYIALPQEKDGPLRAKMWHGEKSRLLLTSPGNSALSVDLFDTGQRVYALSIEARTGATALHARELLARPKPWALSDEVVWVGGSAQPMTELHLLRPTRRPSSELIGLLPLEQDVTHFGLVSLRFAEFTQGAEPDVNWLLYKNGLDPAPISSGTLCGEPVVLLARPSTSLPGSPQELVLAKLVNGRATTEVVLARSKAFYDVSLAGLDQPGKRAEGLAGRGALISYVADYRTWARTVRCIRSR